MPVEIVLGLELDSFFYGGGTFEILPAMSFVFQFRLQGENVCNVTALPTFTNVANVEPDPWDEFTSKESQAKPN